MTNHWVADTFVDAQNVNKSALRSAVRSYVPAYYTVAELRLLTAAGLRSAVVNGFNYTADTSDNTTADDGDLCIVSADGLRFKRTQGTITLRGTWSAVVQYVAGDIVEQGGSSYGAIAPSLNDVPPSANWVRFASPFTGGTLSSKLNLLASAIGGAGLNIGNGTFPSVPSVGDFAGSGNSIFYQGPAGTLAVAWLNLAQTFTQAKTFALDDATTNTVISPLSLERTSTGTPANGIGIRIPFTVETAAGNNEIGAYIDVKAHDVTAASEDFTVAIGTMIAGAAAADRLVINDVGVGFYVTPTQLVHARQDANATRRFLLQNLDAGASAVAAVQVSADAGSVFFQHVSTAAGAYGQFIANGAGGFYIDASHASGARIQFRTGTSFVNAIDIDLLQNVMVGRGLLATNATDGFLYVPTCAGVPTGVPTSKTGFKPIILDDTNDKLYFYSGAAWVAVN